MTSTPEDDTDYFTCIVCDRKFDTSELEVEFGKNGNKIEVMPAHDLMCTGSYATRSYDTPRMSCPSCHKVFPFRESMIKPGATNFLLATPDHHTTLRGAPVRCGGSDYQLIVLR